MITFNIFGVPTAPDPKRFQEIGRRLGTLRERGVAPHVVAIHDAFTSESANFRRLSGYPHCFQGPAAFGFRASGGVAILSEFPFKITSSRVFQVCTGVDCFARKGIVHARMEIPGTGTEIDFFNTHIQAGYENVDSSFPEGAGTRFEQVQQIISWVNQVRDPKNPVIFTGDFNFRADEASYETLKRGIGLAAAAEVCLNDSLSCLSSRMLPYWFPSLIDDVFFMSGRDSALSPESFDFTFLELFEGSTLSDRPGVQVKYRILTLP